MIHNGTHLLKYLLYTSFIIFSMAALNPMAYGQFSSVQSGEWNNPLTWGNLNGIPTSSDVVTIAAGHTVTVAVGSPGCNQCRTLTIGTFPGSGTAVLSFDAGATLTVSESVTLGVVATTSQAEVSFANGGSLIAAQLLPGSTSGTTWTSGTGTVQLTGSGNCLLSTQPFNGFHDLIINKPTGTLALDGNISVSGDWTNHSPVDPSSYTVTFNGSGNQNIGGTAPSAFHHVVNNSGGTLTLDKDISLTGSWTNNAPFDAGTRTVTFTGGSSQTISGSSLAQFYHLLNDKSSSSLVINANLSIAGNWTNNYSVFLAAPVTFNGTGNQIIGGSIPTTFSNVAINKTSGTVALADNPLIISSGLALTSGKLLLGNYDLTLASGAGITGGTTASYVCTDGTGKLKRTVGTKSVVFPVGTTSSYNPATIGISGPADNFSVSVKETLDYPLFNNAYVNRQWSLSEDAQGGNTATLALQWNTADEPLSGFNRNSGLYVFHHNGSWNGTPMLSFTDLGGGVFKVIAQGFTSFSPFAIGNIGATPVELTSFTARYFSPEVRLSWSTATELNNYGFEIERSRDAVEWEVIGFVQGAGNSFSQKNYTYTDNLTELDRRDGSMTYRLRQIDRDGTTEYSKMIYVRLGAISRSIELHPAYPNPFNPATTLSFSLPEAAQLSITVYNVFGQKVATLLDAAYTEAGFHTLEFNGNGLGSGSYLVRFATPDATLQQQIILSK